MTNNRSFRHKLLIGASLSAMLLTSTVHAQSQGGWGRNARGGGADPAATAARAAQDQAIRASQTNSQTQRALDAFRRQAQARTQMQDAQLQARIAAQQAINNVPNGIGQGGLQAAPEIEIDSSLWQGANGPAQSAGKDGRTNVTVEQTDRQAILTWDSFNVGRETDLTFNQQGADWVVLNRVRDADASQIHGSVNAKGTVLILNQNGVLFGGASSVNVRNLVAAGASITNEQFLDRGIYSELSSGEYLPAFTAALGAVTVEAGAQINTHAPETALQGGGYVMLLGSTVSNAGSITTPKGQTLLAAGDDFLIRTGMSSESNQHSTTRGNEVRALIGEGSDAGLVVNRGQIEAEQGDITLAGRTIRQDGVAIATTSVSRRGTIHLLNSASDAQGSVTLGQQWSFTDADGETHEGEGLTAILPELDSDASALNSQRDALIAESKRMDAQRASNASSQFDNLGSLSDRRDQSRIEIVSGGSVLFEGDSQTRAQGGQVVVEANQGRITTENGALIDVSGVQGIALDMGSNSVLVNVQGNELRDSPLNRENDRLKSQDIWIDVRDLVLLPDGTGGHKGDRWYTKGGLLEVGGSLGNIAHGIGEWTSVGGTITLAAREVVAHQGAVFDLSGGSLDYAAGWVNSTRVLGEDGRLYDVGSAPAGMKMVGWGDAYVRKHDRWGEAYTQVWSHPLGGARNSRRWSEGYSVGRDAGTLTLSAPTILFDGMILADVLTGERQTVGRVDGVTDGFKVGQDQVAQAGALVIGRQNGFGSAGGFEGRAEIGDFDAPDAPISLEDAITEDRINTVLLDARRLNEAGLGRLDITVAGPLAISSDLTLADGAQIHLAGGTVDIAADVTARSGAMTVRNLARVATVDPMNDPAQMLAGEGSSAFTLHEGATIDLRGVWTNGADALPSSAHVDGGTLDVRMVRGSVMLEAGSLIDVSSGATLLQTGELTGGRGGDVALIAGALDGVSGGDSTAPNPIDTRLTLDGDIRAYGVEGGGKLTLHSPTTTTFGEDDMTRFLAEGVLPPGAKAPTAVVLSEDAVIRGDQILPNGFSLSMQETPLDTPLPSGIEFQWSRQKPDGSYEAAQVITKAEWVIGPQMVVYAFKDGMQHYFYGWNGDVVPAGMQISHIQNYEPAGMTGVILPSAVFSMPIPLARPVNVTIAPGGKLGFDYTYKAGETVPAGTAFADGARFQPALGLDAGLLQSGFSDYVVTSRAGLHVAQDAQLRVETPVLRLHAGSAATASGADPAVALERWTPPAFQDDVLTGEFHQRAGADLTLRAADIRLAEGSLIAVDPGHSIRLAAQGAQILEGDLIAHGGRITAVTEGVLDLFFSPDVVRYRDAAEPFKADAIKVPGGASIWVGEAAHLDVSGLGRSATDHTGRRYGFAQDGGRIQLGVEDYQRVDSRRDFVRASDMHVIIREGARLDASGAAVTVDLGAGSGASASLRPVTLAGDGGHIALGSQRSIFNDGTLVARAGGAGAAGGVLNLVLENDINYVHPGYKVLTIAQDRQASGLAADMRADALDPGLAYGVARISVEEIAVGGFGTLDLLSRDVFAFDGNIDLSMQETLVLRRGLFTIADPAAASRVKLSAAYVHLDGAVPHNTGQDETVYGLRQYPGETTVFNNSSANVGTLSINADLIDISNQVQIGHDTRSVYETDNLYLPGFDAVDLTSRTDIRFTNGLLTSGGDMTLTAAQLYPTTQSSGTILLGRTSYDPNPEPVLRTLTIRGTGVIPDVPYSVFGQMRLAASIIDQGGVVRAPLGGITFQGPDNLFASQSTIPTDVTLRAGSVTSTSAAGLLMPYGGTSDGVDYRYDGKVINFLDVIDVQLYSGYYFKPQGVAFELATLRSEAGSLIDVSGGGELTGAGFVSGRGGSVDVLRTALANANPAYGGSGRNAVYAIVPSSSAAYAPIAPDAGTGDPHIGQTITLTQETGGLPAGTYVLMPSTYALLPGAYRVEIGAASTVDNGKVMAHNGSFVASGYLGVAASGLRDALPTELVLTPAETVRTFSSYDETSYAAFAATQAALFGASAPRTERDAQVIHFGLRQEGDVLDYQGEVKLQAAKGGRAGAVFVTGGSIEVRAEDAAAATDMISLSEGDLARLGAGTLVLGGVYDLEDVTIDNGVYVPEALLGQRYVASPYSVILREGTRVEAGDVFLVGSDIVLERGATLRGVETAGGALSASIYPVNARGGMSVLSVSGGNVDVGISSDAQAAGSIRVDDGAALIADGSIGFATSGSTTLGDVDITARRLSFADAVINIGHEDVLAGASPYGAISSGAKLSVERLTALAGSVRGLEQLVLNASGSLNLAGDFTLDLTGGAGAMDLVLKTPAVYGWGGSADTARITADRLVWTGQTIGTGFERTTGNEPLPVTVSAPPAPVTAGGAGTGSGRLVLAADQILFGYDNAVQKQTQATVDRLALGFAGVEISASQQISANARGTLSVYHSGADAASYTGGSLAIRTPVLTGDSGSFMALRTGGELDVRLPEGAQAADLSAIDALGGEIRLAGQQVRVDAPIVLPSGRLVIEAEQGIELGAQADFDLSGRTIAMFDQSVATSGGDILLETGSGNISQHADSVWDVSASGADAGAIRLAASGGQVALGGTMRGQGGTGYDSGSFGLKVNSLADFAGLNHRLTDSGFLQARSFTLGSGNLVVGDEVQAHKVEISVDNGSLTIDGRINASGEKVGTIRLAAKGDLILTGGAELDVHGTVLQRDGRGAVIDASNRGHVELTSRNGLVTLASGALIDLRSADTVSRGQVEINAQRLGADNVAVNAAMGVDVRGAASVAVNAMRSYAPADGQIDQGLMDAIHHDSVAFIDATLANDAVGARLAGLTALGEAFHLRPGVELTGDDLTVIGDIDLSAYRYGPGADGSVRGSGETGLLVVRAGKDLTINGSLTDGFAPPPATPDDYGWLTEVTYLQPGVPTTEEVKILLPINPAYSDRYFFLPSYNTGAYPTVVSGQITDGMATYGPGMQIPGYFYGEVTIAPGTELSATDPADATLKMSQPSDTARPLWAIAPMLDAGMSSWSMRLVGGADLDAADTRSLASMAALGGRGHVTLDDLHFAGTPMLEAPSVVRTGTGYLDILAGGDYRHDSLFGVYTAGTQSADTQDWAADRSGNVNDPSTVLGPNFAAYEHTLNDQRMYFTEGGGDVFVTVQGDVSHKVETVKSSPSDPLLQPLSDSSTWFWRQGGAASGALTAWGINFGQYAVAGQSYDPVLRISGFKGLGTLGGGNVTMRVGGDAGLLAADPMALAAGLNLAVGSSGRMTASGELIQTGGGDIDLDIAGRFNTRYDHGMGNGMVSGGSVTNIRGDIYVAAGAIGLKLDAAYGHRDSMMDPRAPDYGEAGKRYGYAPLRLEIGDGVADIRSRGDLVVATGTNPGLRDGGSQYGMETAATWNGMPGKSATSFSLWTDRSALHLLSLGGDVNQLRTGQQSMMDPGIVTIAATRGSIDANLMLAPAPGGILSLLAWNGLYGQASMSSAASSELATPFNPVWAFSENYDLTWGGQSNSNKSNVYLSDVVAFGRGTATSLHADTDAVLHLYAVEGDIILNTGVMQEVGLGQNSIFAKSYTIAQPVRMWAGRDIISDAMMLNNDANDLSIIRAGRDILNSEVEVFGPGHVEISAGRNVYSNAKANGYFSPAFNSRGALIEGDTRPGAGISLMAGIGGAGAPRYADFAALYLDPANLADGERPLADQPGKVVRVYDKELLLWLGEEFGYQGDAAGARAYFDGLQTEHQHIFLREIYFEELRLAGREYNDAAGGRYGSYLRGRNAIEVLFPDKDAEGQAIVRTGSVTLLETAGVHTDFGGNIDVLTPGGGVTLGTSTFVPPASTGLMTQGEGNIHVFAQNSVLLGLSRVFTTFGGDITMWSEEGDINAGRGANGSIVYAPVRIVYDAYGNSNLSPTVPTSGAGIGTLNPIPEIAAGDIDLIAPLGTIDAGEAGIRVSGNINLAALQVLNAANIKVQGEASGIPVVAAVNTGALTSASSASTAVANQAAELAERARPQVRTEIPTILNVRFLGFGE